MQQNRLMNQQQNRKRADGKNKVVVPMQTYRLEVGKTNAVTPSNIVGAIANESGVDAKLIGRIDIFDDYSTVDLPQGMPKDILQHLNPFGLQASKFT